ncbi:hypothetical protein AB4Y45_35640 [Paraburkholderia sp. EG287A]|uniref:hypothetical protein n=1 Tax=Paraburkholderia sp. EG287A TaxID=3237012 RepID=UPI0034D39103
MIIEPSLLNPVTFHSALFELLRQQRSVFEMVLERSLGRAETTGCCMYGAILVQTAVQQWLPDCVARICGGDGHADGGYVDSAGAHHGHYWVEVAHADSTWVADITADQFDAPAVQLLNRVEAGEFYRAGDQQLVERHMAEVLESMGVRSAVALA